MYNSSLKVLLIEDNPGDARLIRETLRKTNTTRYEMEWVDRLSPGLAQLARDAIDIVLLDLSLPDSYGSETLERTLSQSKEVPIVVLTGLDDEELAIQALRNGAQDYLIKSDVNSTLLGRSISYAIERKRAEVALQRAHDTLEERVRERTDAFVMQNKKLLKEIEERRHAENLYQTLAEKSMAGVYIVQDKIFRYLNSNAAAYAGYTPEELVGREAFCIVHPADRKWVKLKARQMLKGERKAPYEFRIQRRDGRERWILETITSTVYEGKPAILGNSMDVTDMKKAGENVRESRQLLSNIISFLPDAMLIIDQNGEVLAWNRAMEELTGVEAEDMVGLDNYEYSIPFYGERRPILIDLALKADGNIENKYLFIQKEKDLLVAETDAPCVRGENRILWGKAAPIRNTNGEIVGAIETIRDTTKRKQMENALRESETKYRELVQNANSIIYRRDTEGNITFFNEYAQGFFGYSEDEILGKNVVGTIVPEVDSAGNDLTAMIADISAAPDRYVINENENIRSNGERAWIAWTNKALRDENGTIQEIFCIGTDITERKRVEKERWETEHRYHTLFDHSPMGVLHYDIDFRVIDCNEAAASILRAPREHVVGFDLKSLEDRSVIQALTAPLEGNEGVFEGFYKTTASRSDLWMSLRTTPLYSHDGTIDGGVAIMEDISDRVRANQTLEESKRALETKARSLEETNTALKVLFDQVEKNRQELEWNVLYNVKQLILPYIEKLKACRTDNDRDTCLQVLETNLTNIVSPFLRQMTLTHYKLTPKELHVATLVKEGKTNKDIADLLHLSLRSVEFHRENIRKKLGLKNKKANLRSFLLSLE